VRQNKKIIWSSVILCVFSLVLILGSVYDFFTHGKHWWEYLLFGILLGILGYLNFYNAKRNSYFLADYFINGQHPFSSAAAAGSFLVLSMLFGISYVRFGDREQ
jgi:uncharacterized membrane protein HdeD (DUF308 family)